MILKRLGIGKKSEYFLEAEPLSSEEIQAHTEAEAVKPAAAVLAEPVPELSPREAKSVEPKQKKSKKSKAGDSAASPSAAAEPKAAPAPKAAPKPEPAVVNFATDYLMQANTPRRRPGPSLNMFKDMAKQVNPRK
ncbi:MAG: hypothetical protein KME15_25990 [Drouetiella hepatica Uher 2000/2452]|jgi:hypothetical protein|uniref:Uncharacterized protein n=1 Tax=Drouetiella hepatica Uher 2000/2452 TaxID=904376 RepID=A0A951UQ91_9CYAN|nr:hypothetical protein [Drouetiella hepatica Uher 2000/2452]